LARLDILQQALPGAFGVSYDHGIQVLGGFIGT
jgi:hypothetical protein